MSRFTNPASGAGRDAGAYVAGLLELIGDRDPLSILRETPARLERILEAVPEPLASRAEAPGKWSVREVLRHLADSELVWSYRLRLVLAEEGPTLGGYDQDAWARRLGYDEADMRQAVDEFTVVRRGNLALLDRAAPEDLERVALHAERGEESVTRMIRLYAGHDLVHLRQIERIRSAIGG